MKLSEQLKAARDLNLSKRCNGCYARDVDGDAVHPLHPNAVTFCALGAMKKIAGPECDPGDDCLDCALEVNTKNGVISPMVVLFEAQIGCAAHNFHDMSDDDHLRIVWDAAIARAEAAELSA